MRRAQSAVEFVLLVSFMLLIFFSFFLSFQNKIVEINRAQDVQYLKEANDVIISELQLAQRMYADYERTFYIPYVTDKIYEINLTDTDEITAKYNDLEYVNFLHINVSGDLFASGVENGKNTIYRTDGVTYLPGGIVYKNTSHAGFHANVNPELCYLHNQTNTCDELDDINSRFREYCFTYFGIVCNI